MNNIRKFIYYLKKSGFRQAVLLTASYIHAKLRYILFKLLARLLAGGKIKSAAEKCRGKTVVVFTPSVEWSFLFQRAQQMATAYAKEGIVVLFLTTQRQYDSFAAIHETTPNVFLMNENLASRIDEICESAETVVTSVYNIGGLPLTKLYRSDRIVYEYVDDISVTVSGADDLAEKRKIHERLLERADLVVATASKLLSEAQKVNPHVIFSPNAADYAFFSAPAKANEKYAELREKYACVISYYGALASWFDYGLVREIAEKRPDWVWLLIGKKIDNDMEKSRIERMPNVVYSPSVPYSELPSYIACADIMTIPFVINEITEATSPVKLFEYMSAGKPIVTSDMNECRRYESVRIYKSADDFIDIVEDFLSDKNNADYRSLLKKEAQENTWDSRAKAVLDALR